MSLTFYNSPDSERGPNGSIPLEPDAIFDGDGRERPWNRRKTRTKLSPEEWGDLFLEEYAQTGNVLRSALYAGVDRSTIYARLREDPEFRDRYDLAAEDYKDVIRGAFHDRAIHGTRTEREIWQMATLPGGVKIPVHVTTEVTVRYSDQLLIHYAKSKMRQEFGEDRYGNNPAAEFDLETAILQMAEEEGVPAELIRAEWDRIAIEVEKARKNDEARRLR